MRDKNPLALPRCDQTVSLEAGQRFPDHGDADTEGLTEILSRRKLATRRILSSDDVLAQRNGDAIGEALRRENLLGAFSHHDDSVLSTRRDDCHAQPACFCFSFSLFRSEKSASIPTPTRFNSPQHLAH